MFLEKKDINSIASHKIKLRVVLEKRDKQLLDVFREKYQNCEKFSERKIWELWVINVELRVVNSELLDAFGEKTYKLRIASCN